MAAQLLSRENRVEDYLNDKLQTTADLESLDTLLIDVQKQQELLKRQVRLWILCFLEDTTDLDPSSFEKPKRI